MSLDPAIAAEIERKTRTSVEPMSLRFTLPWPPSVNTYWRNVVIGGAGRVLLSRDGREYRVEASNALLSQRVPRKQLTGRLAIYVVAHPPDRRARDLDNLWKGVLDSLKHCNVIEDDSHFDDERIIRGPVVPGGELKIVIDEIAGEPMKSGKLFTEGA